MGSEDGTQRKDLSVAVGGFQKLLGYRLVRWEQDLAEIELDATGDQIGRAHV